MTRAPQTLWLLRILVALMLLWAAAGAWAGDVDEARQAMDRAKGEVSVIETKKKALEASFEERLREVEALKREGALVDFELQEQLSETRAQAEELGALSRQLREARAREREAHDALLEAYEVEIAALEDQIFEVSSSEQPLIIQRLEALQVEREAARAARPAAETFESFEVPELAELASDDPEELMAATAELTASEREMLEHLQELDSRIRRLEERRRLLAFAEDTSDETSLFGEEDTPTQISGQQRSRAEQPEAQPTTDASGDLGAPTPTTGGEPNTPEAAPPTSDDRDGAMDPANDFSTGGLESEGGGVGFEPVGDRVNEPDLGTPDSGTSVPVIRSDADTNAVVKGRGAGFSRRGLEREIQRLRGRKKKLKRSLEEVKDQKERLEERTRAFRY